MYTMYTKMNLLSVQIFFFDLFHAFILIIRFAIFLRFLIIPFITLHNILDTCVYIYIVE